VPICALSRFRRSTRWHWRWLVEVRTRRQDRLQSNMTYNAEQWHFIGIAFRNGVIFWVVMVAYAAVHDLFVASMSHTDQSFMPGASLSLSRIVYTIHWKRNRFGHKYRDRNILTVVDVLRAALNVIACVVYVVGTYQRTV
jgi:hypothetical protein